MTSMSNGSSVYSLTKHHDRAKKKDLRKKLKSESKVSGTIKEVQEEHAAVEQDVETVCRQSLEEVQTESKCNVR